MLQTRRVLGMEICKSNTLFRFFQIRYFHKLSEPLAPPHRLGRPHLRDWHLFKLLTFNILSKSKSTPNLTSGTFLAQYFMPFHRVQSILYGVVALNQRKLWIGPGNIPPQKVVSGANIWKNGSRNAKEKKKLGQKMLYIFVSGHLCLQKDVFHECVQLLNV